MGIAFSTEIAMTNAVHIVCPHCDAINRLPETRLSDTPQCGKCHQPLFAAQPLELDTRRFDRHIERSDLPVLVDFWAPWCGPCRMMAPAFAQAAGVLEPQLRLVKVNTEAEPALGSRFGIRSIPTLALFHHGREVARQAGAMGTADIVRWARQHVGG